jgi:hypothetical protein
VDLYVFRSITSIEISLIVFLTFFLLTIIYVIMKMDH